MIVILFANCFRFGSLVEPVVWMYAENLDDQIYPDMWSRFSEVFPNMWAASAFKGEKSDHIDANKFLVHFQ